MKIRIFCFFTAFGKKTKKNPRIYRGRSIKFKTLKIILTLQSFLQN